MTDLGDRLKRIEKAAQAASRGSAASAGRGLSSGIRVTILDDSKKRGKGVDRIFDALDATMEDIPNILADTVPTIREIHKQVFATEGSAGRGAWAGLSPRTIAQRKRLGFGAGPILKRTGALEDHVLTTPAQITRDGDGYELRIQPDPSVGGVKKYRALALGYAKNSLPGRPMVAIGPTGARKFTTQLARLLRARAAANGLR